MLLNKNEIDSEEVFTGTWHGSIGGADGVGKCA